MLRLCFQAIRSGENHETQRNSQQGIIQASDRLA
jgi:hypothetical protein